MTVQSMPTEDELNEFLHRFVTDLGAAAASANVVLGERLGLYATLAQIQPATAADLAAKSGSDVRYVTEWLRGQVAGAYIGYDADTDSYSMSPAQAFHPAPRK